MSLTSTEFELFFLHQKNEVMVILYLSNHQHLFSLLISPSLKTVSDAGPP